MRKRSDGMKQVREEQCCSDATDMNTMCQMENNLSVNGWFQMRDEEEAQKKKNTKEENWISKGNSKPIERTTIRNEWFDFRFEFHLNISNYFYSLALFLPVIYVPMLKKWSARADPLGHAQNRSIPFHWQSFKTHFIWELVFSNFFYFVYFLHHLRLQMPISQSYTIKWRSLSLSRPVRIDRTNRTIRCNSFFSLFFSSHLIPSASFFLFWMCAFCFACNK